MHRSRTDWASRSLRLREARRQAWRLRTHTRWASASYGYSVYTAWIRGAYWEDGKGVLRTSATLSMNLDLKWRLGYVLRILMVSKFTYYFVWRNLPTNSNYFTKIYLLFSVTLVIINRHVFNYILSCLSRQQSVVRSLFLRRPGVAWGREKYFIWRGHHH